MVEEFNPKLKLAIDKILNLNSDFKLNIMEDTLASIGSFVYFCCIPIKFKLILQISIYDDDSKYLITLHDAKLKPKLLELFPEDNMSIVEIKHDSKG